MSLVIENLSFAYGRREVLTDVTTTWQNGRVVGLLGPNGSGKSTLVGCLAGLLTHRGSASLDGRPVGQERDSIGYLPQDLPGRVGLCAIESVLVASRRGPVWRTSAEEVRRAWRALDEVGMAELANRPLGAMSGGQRQLVALAQTLVREPTLMLLDEPTSALDLRHQVSVLSRMRQTVRGENARLAVIALHDLNLAARYCDEVALLAGGRLVASGPPVEVLRADLLEQVYGVRARVVPDGGHVLVVPEDGGRLRP